MASGMELTINNAEEAAVNAPFNSTGLPDTGTVFLLQLEMLDERQLHQALWLCLWLHCQVFSSTSILIAEPLMGFHQGATLMEFPTSPATVGSCNHRERDDVHKKISLYSMSSV